MKNNAKVIKEGNKTIIEESDNKYTPDPMYPYVKKATKHKMQNVKTLFSKYIALYSTILSSGSSQNIITTDQIIKIGSEYNLNRTTVEKCIKELVVVEELIKVQRGVYMINPKHVSGGRTPEASQDLITKAEAIQNTQNVQTQNNNNTYSGPITVVVDESLLEKVLRKASRPQDIENF